MSSSRRGFIKQAAMLSGLGAAGLLNESIRRAWAIEPVAGTSYLDAEHIVVLMQENRSFDHVFGTLRGVRGFRDPRAIRLPDGYPVWAQPDGQGQRFLPFRLHLKESRSTWMGDLPHSWPDQVDARHEGLYDRWLTAKRSRRQEFADMPLTLGYYTRDDLPFYYALADAFTVCDQNFCSCLTGTTPNRLHLWTGTARAQQTPDSPAHVLNSDVDYGRWANWTTFPERLQDLGISWKVYQNELSLESGLQGEEDAWLSNFTDNPLEWFEQYAVRFAATHRAFVLRRLQEIPEEIQQEQSALQTATSETRQRLSSEIAELQTLMARYQQEQQQFSSAQLSALSDRARQLHQRAFTTNHQDPDYRQLAELEYLDGEQPRRLSVPKGDVLYQFRQDVQNGTLPTISWLVPSQRFSDHPGSAWFGAWFLSETLDILTKNPDVWRKTVFILTYDENDGYFDHVPPFVAPDPSRPETGRVSAGIDASLEYVPIEQDRQWHPQQARGSSIGLGYRVPMVIASPWSRGGAVCSQVFDHTSVLQFMERVLSHQKGLPIRETNINSWRRAVCGDLTAAFQSPADISSPLRPLDHNDYVAQIHQAKFKDLPQGYRRQTASDLESIQRGSLVDGWLPQQELGLRPACPLPYELFVTGSLNPSRDALVVRMEARKDLFQDKAAGAPFTAYVFTEGHSFYCRNYAVEPGSAIEDSWLLSEFERGFYRVHVHGPNGYFWVLSGGAQDPRLEVQLAPAKSGQQVAEAVVQVRYASGGKVINISVVDHSYGNPQQLRDLPAGSREAIAVSTGSSHRWYDFSLRVADHSQFERRFAGHIENGAWSFNDPLFGI
jgi:phospholipase C